MIEQEVIIQSGDIKLKGILCLPVGDGPFPVLLYVSGSGPIDRNENIPGLRLNNSKIITHHLAQQYIASLRYDKRGVGDSGGDFYSASHSDLVDDAVACTQFLQQQTSIETEKIFVAGHSEGSIIATQVAIRQQNIAGIILLSPFCDEMESILMKQAQHLKSMVMGRKGLKALPWKFMTFLFDPTKAQKKLINKIKESDKPFIRFLGLQKVPANWFRELFTYSVLHVEQKYRQSNVPGLLIGGSKDFQCDPCDVVKIENIYGGSAEAHIVENMSHLLRKEEEEPSVFNYRVQLKQTIMPEVLELIDAWLQRQLRDLQSSELNISVSNI
jgi:hypothetical protein